MSSWVSTTTPETAQRGRASRFGAAARQLLGVAFGLSLLLTACGGGGNANDTRGPITATGDALIEAARGEGTLTVYSNMSPQNLKQLVDVFEKKFDITVEGVDIDSTLGTRYMSEAQSGQMVADVVIMPTDWKFIEDARQAGFIAPISDLGVEAIASGAYPKQFLSDDGIALLGLSPLGIAVNTNMVPDGAIKDWLDLTRPEYAGKIIVPDPRTSTYYLQSMDALYGELGPEFFQALGKNNPRGYVSGGEGAQQLAGGEAALMFPCSLDTFASVIADGAPVKWIPMATTSAYQYAVIPTSPQLTPHPNAQKLFVDYFLSKEGNLDLYSVGGDKSVYAPADQLPANLITQRDPRQIDTLDPMVSALNLK